MNKKLLTVLSLVLVVALVGGGIWFFTRPSDNLLVRQNLENLSAKEIIDTLQTRPKSENKYNLVAGVKATELELKDDQGSVTVPITEGFYLSVAPYIQMTHECFNHSLTTCQGELVNEPIQLKIFDTNGKTLFDQSVTTEANGFYGVWLERDQQITVLATYKDYAGSVVTTTNADAPTCVTTLKLHEGV